MDAKFLSNNHVYAAGLYFQQISSSFDTMDPFGTGQVLPPLQVPLPHMQDTIVPPLKKPPKWVRRPVGASFAVSAAIENVQHGRDVLLST